MNLERINKRLNDALNGYRGVVGSIEKKLKNQVKFTFAIKYSEGRSCFILVNTKTGIRMRLEDCIKAIKLCGVLTEEDHYKAGF